MRRLKRAPRRRGFVGRFCRIGVFIVTVAALSAGVHAALRLGRPLSWGQGTHAARPEAVAGTIAAHVEDHLLALSAQLGFAVSDIAVEGRRTTAPATILKALDARRGMPILAVDPRRAAARLAGLPWVRSATVERRLPGTILVRLVERRPLALWQHDNRIELIDRHGGVIPVGDLGRFAQLPLVVGPDADAHASVLLQMLAQEPALATHVNAAIRIGDRRWNLRLDDGIEVLLPADDPAAAWAELARLERKSAILKRDVKVIDMRLPDRLVLRVAAPPPSGDTKKKERPPARNT